MLTEPSLLFSFPFLALWKGATYIWSHFLSMYPCRCVVSRKQRSVSSVIGTLSSLAVFSCFTLETMEVHLGYVAWPGFAQGSANATINNKKTLMCILLTSLLLFNTALHSLHFFLLCAVQCLQLSHILGVSYCPPGTKLDYWVSGIPRSIHSTQLDDYPHKALECFDFEQWLVK